MQTLSLRRWHTGNNEERMTSPAGSPPLISVMSGRTFPVASKLQSGCEEGKLLPLAVKLQKVNFTDISSDYTLLPCHFYLIVLGIISQPGDCDKSPLCVFLTLHIIMYRDLGENISGGGRKKRHKIKTCDYDKHPRTRLESKEYSFVIARVHI